MQFLFTLSIVIVIVIEHIMMNRMITQGEIGKRIQPCFLQGKWTVNGRTMIMFTFKFSFFPHDRKKNDVLRRHFI